MKSLQIFNRFRPDAPPKSIQLNVEYRALYELFVGLDSKVVDLVKNMPDGNRSHMISLPCTGLYFLYVERLDFHSYEIVLVCNRNSSLVSEALDWQNTIISAAHHSLKGNLGNLRGFFPSCVEHLSPYPEACIVSDSGISVRSPSFTSTIRFSVDQIGV